jgi:putative DNA primase/helicase
VTADEVLGRPNTEDRSELEDAKHFLLDLLEKGPVPSRQVKADAVGADYSWATIRRAKDVLGIEIEKQGMKGGWVWKLPPKILKNAEDAHEKNVSTFGENEHLREGEVDKWAGQI